MNELPFSSKVTSVANIAKRILKQKIFVNYLRTIPLPIHIRTLYRYPTYHIGLALMFSRKIDSSFMPVYLSIETTRMCNLRCIMCEHTIDFTNDNNYMSKESFMKLINNIPPQVMYIGHMDTKAKTNAMDSPAYFLSSRTLPK